MIENYEVNFNRDGHCETYNINMHRFRWPFEREWKLQLKYRQIALEEAQIELRHRIENIRLKLNNEQII